MKTLFILNDPRYGTDRIFNAVRLAPAMEKTGAEITIFLMADAVEEEVIEGASRSTMDELAAATVAADKVLGS